MLNLVGLLRYIVVVFLFLSCSITAVFAQDTLRPVKGVVDARHWNFYSSTISLDGEWKFYDNQLLSPDEIDQHVGIDFPLTTIWNKHRADGSGLGVGTYKVEILLPSTMDAIAVALPQVYNACKLWANGKEVLSVGSIDKEKPKPQWILRSVTIPVKGEERLQLVLQISNYHHHKGGITNPIYIGYPKRILNYVDEVIWSSIIASAIIGSIGLMLVVMYVLNGRRIYIYFGLVCVTWGIRLCCSTSYPITYFFPDFNWNSVARIEYCTLYLVQIFAILFFGRLFIMYVNKYISNALIIVNVIFLAITLVTKPILFTRFLNLYLVVATLVILYLVYLLVRSIISKQVGAWLLVVTMLQAMSSFIYDMFSYQGNVEFNYLFLNISYVVTFVLISLSLYLFMRSRSRNRMNDNILRYSDFFPDSTYK
jgi:hypothetical protein